MRNIFYLAKAFGILNSLVVFFDGHVQAVSDNFFFKKYSFYFNKTTSEVLFPDKLKDMNGYIFRVFVTSQEPRIRCKKDFCRGVDIDVMRIIAEKHNARVAIETISIDRKDARTFVYSSLNNGNFDMSLLTMMEFYGTNKFWRKINTFDVNAFCAMIPLPEKLSFLMYLLSPFDLSSWLSMLLVIAGSAIIWQITRKINSVSTFSFIYGVCASFVGQSIPFTNISGIQMTMLQLCFLMNFIMDNAYESLIIASMMYSREGVRLRSFGELFASDMKIVVTEDYFLKFILNNDTDFLRNMVVASEYNQGVKTGRCDMLYDYFNSKKFHYYAENYYMLPDQIMPLYEQFFLAISSPFYDLVQTNFALIFESGIRQHLQSQFDTSEFMGAGQDREAEFVRKEKYLFALSDIDGVFLILAAGYFIAVLSFLIEIGWFFLQNNWRKVLGLVRRMKKAKLFKRR